MPRRPRQLELPRTAPRGGARKGAGRKPSTDRRALVRHRPRPQHRAAFPVHVTLRARPPIPALRLQKMFVAARDVIAHSSNTTFRILQFSVQDDHIHLIVEADDGQALSLGIAALKIRMARRINRALRRHGAVWADRYHARALRTPTEVRAALIYVLQNWKKHSRGARGLDGRSSAAWFEGWADRPTPPAEAALVSPPRTWFAAIGWRRCTVGPIRKDETPGPPRRGF